MFQFIESIKYENGEIHHLNWHQKRVNDTFEKFFPGKAPWDLSEILFVREKLIGSHKLRLLYHSKFYRFELLAYETRKIQNFEFLPIDFDYAYKFEDRKNIDAAKSTSKRDEVIFTKNNYLLDSTYANLAFFDGLEWFTPSTFLLNGTTRQRLISENKLKVMSIKINDLHQFEKISFINAMNDLNVHTLLL